MLIQCLDARLLVAYATLVALGAELAWARGSEDLTAARSKLEVQHQQTLEALAAWCDAEGLKDRAAQTRVWARPRDPWELQLVLLGSSPVPSIDGALSTSGVSEWQTRFWEQRRAQGDALFALARTALRQQRASLAFELVLAAVRENPDLEAGRRMLGYQRYADGWYTPFEIRHLRSGKVWHERFGWLPANHVERYEQGERFVNGRWLTAEREAQFRADLRNGWRVETEHYEVLTNHSLEAGVRLGQKLEQLYRAWQQTFAAYYTSADQLTTLFEGRGPARRTDRRHQVIYFRNRDEYQQALRGELPLDVETTGFYWGDRRTAYFFAHENQDDSTLLHEATHQLFSETRPVVRDIGREANFWAIEGIACYMESLRFEAGNMLVGGTDAVRFQDAQHRLLVSEFHVPLSELTRWGMHALQRNPNIRMLYSQSAGLMHFLMHYDQGRYRDALVAYLLAIYTGRDTPHTLAQLTGTPYDELDRQYREFVEAAR